MKDCLIVYYSRTGVTAQVAQALAGFARELGALQHDEPGNALPASALARPG